MTFLKRIEKHYKLSNDDFEKQFKNCTLNPVLFTHEAHLRLAFNHIIKYGREQAIKNICSQLKKYVVYAGSPDKYHETITDASINEIADRLENSKHSDFKDFLLDFPELMSDFKNVINSKYDFDVFQSKEAKDSFISPEKN